MSRVCARAGARAFLVVGIFLLSVAGVRADEVGFRFDADLSGMPPGGFIGGESIPYSVFVTIGDTEGDGYDSQGLQGFTFDILSNTEIMQPALDFAPTSTLYSYITITDNVWSTGKTPTLVGGFGMGFLAETGNNTTSIGDVLGPGSAIGLSWDADVDNNAGNGLQPMSLNGIGIGAPPGTDIGGNQVPPAGARDQWYLMQGQINVPMTPGLYTVMLDPQGAGVIMPTADLNTDLNAGWVLTSGLLLTGDSFEFMVAPEPATLSFLLLAGAAFAWRRRR